MMLDTVSEAYDVYFSDVVGRHVSIISVSSFQTHSWRIVASRVASELKVKVSAIHRRQDEDDIDFSILSQ